MAAGEWVGIGVGVIAILEAARRLIRAIYRLVRLWETGFAEVAAMKKELHPNGGNSLRDVVDETHRIAVRNGAATGDAARLAAMADQRVRELQAQQKQQHLENVDRLDKLEETSEARDIATEFFLGVLRDKYDIDLLPDDD